MKNSGKKPKIFCSRFLPWNVGHFGFYDSQQGTYNFKTALSNTEKICTHVEGVYIKEHTQETHIILCILYRFGAHLNWCSGKDILWKSGWLC